MPLGPCTSIDAVLIKIYAHCFSVALSLLLIHTLLCTLSTRHSSPGLYQDQASTSAKWEHTHTQCFHLCLSSDCVSQCLGRKIGFCRAQRLESPKAACQIQLLQSVSRHASHHSSHFKLHSLSPTTQLLTDGFLFLLHGVSSVEASLLFFVLSHLGSFALCIAVLFSFIFHTVFVCLFVSGDVCSTSLAVCCTDWFSYVETWVVFSRVLQSWNQNISFFFPFFFFKSCWNVNVFCNTYSKK